MTAKEMFERLGYIKKWSNPRWTLYQNSDKNREVSFLVSEQEWHLYSWNEEQGTGLKEPTPEEKKAIDKQAEELGWL